MAELCCVLNPKCFECRVSLCTTHSWIGTLKDRLSSPGGIYVLCDSCKDDRR